MTSNTAQASVLPVPGGPYSYAAEARKWGPATYAKFLTLVLLPCAVILGAGFAVGQPWTAGIIAAAPVALLVFWRPEFGVLLLALYVPFEYFGRMSPTMGLKGRPGSLRCRSVEWVHRRVPWLLGHMVGGICRKA